MVMFVRSSVCLSVCLLSDVCTHKRRFNETQAI